MALKIYKLTVLSFTPLSGDCALLDSEAFLAGGGEEGGGDFTFDADLLRGGVFCT